MVCQISSHLSLILFFFTGNTIYVHGFAESEKIKINMEFEKSIEFHMFFKKKYNDNLKWHCNNNG